MLAEDVVKVYLSRNTVRLFILPSGERVMLFPTRKIYAVARLLTKILNKRLRRNNIKRFSICLYCTSKEKIKQIVGLLAAFIFFSQIKVLC